MGVVKSLIEDRGIKVSNKCKRCNEEFSNENVYSSAGWRETEISGLCEKCFDEITAEPDKHCGNCKYEQGYSPINFQTICNQKGAPEGVNWRSDCEFWEERG